MLRPRGLKGNMTHLGAPGFEAPQSMLAGYEPLEIARFFVSGTTITDTGLSYLRVHVGLWYIPKILGL